jgi:hypothetical protein
MESTQLSEKEDEAAIHAVSVMIHQQQLEAFKGSV